MQDGKAVLEYIGVRFSDGSLVFPVIHQAEGGEEPGICKGREVCLQLVGGKVLQRFHQAIPVAVDFTT